MPRDQPGGLTASASLTRHELVLLLLLLPLSVPPAPRRNALAERCKVAPQFMPWLPQYFTGDVLTNPEQKGQQLRQIKTGLMETSLGLCQWKKIVQASALLWRL